ncbi:N2227-like protein-domain-containing protein [Chaetomium sp. MPI-CAGE-AT-0009]|nr:N2227-like protein-domain-containing protein [Chaetomium sp. MPI-CAGE-AT-0009]
MRSSAWTVAALCWLSAGRVLCDEVDSQSHSGLVGVDASDPQYLVYEVHEVEVVLAENERLSRKLDTQRHLEEKEKLLTRLSKSHGTWNEHHARHRLLEALRGFSAYADTQQAELNRLKGLYSHVPKKQKSLLERTVKYSQKFTDVAELLKKNQQLCDDIVRNAMEFYGVTQQELDKHIKAMKKVSRPAERVSVSQALKHFVRDWAASGAHERDAAFPCILQALKDQFPDAGEKEVKILLPGAGLGRLGHEVAQLPGFQVTNNEWSAYQNIAYRFLTRPTPSNTHSHAPNTTTLHPFIDSWSHHRRTSDMLRAIPIPDIPIHPNDVLLVEGDFTTAFRGEGDAGGYDALVTHFFIDTARNLAAYLDTIARLVPPGGVWVNFGPLLYGSAPFVQLALDEVVALAEAVGFEFVEVPVAVEGGLGVWGECKAGGGLVEGKKVYGVEAVYGFDERALTRNAYEAVFWVARRV